MGNLKIAIKYLQYTGSNTIKVALYKDSDPNVEAAAQYLQGPFTDGTFGFNNLDNVAYKAKRFEVANDDHSHILADYGVFFVFTPDNTGITYRNPVEWTAGVDYMPDGTLFPAGVSSFANTDWIGWNITSLTTFSSSYPQSSFSFNPATGTLSLFREGDIFEQDVTYSVGFEIKINVPDGSTTSGGSGLFSGKKYITEDTTLATTDANKLILIKGTASAITVTLPPLNDTPELQPFHFQFPTGNIRLARVPCAAGDTIDFGKGSRTIIRFYPTESFSIYKELDTETDPDNPVAVWRVFNAVGNFLTVGETVSDEADANHVINKLSKNSTTYSATVYERIYEEFILKLPSSQVVPYSSWGSGENRYKFSLKDAITGLFHVPDTSNMFERQSSGTRAPNTFEKNAMIDHKHAETIGELPDTLDGTTSPVASITGTYDGTRNHYRDLTSTQYILASPGGWIKQESSSETRPDSVANNKWLRH